MWHEMSELPDLQDRGKEILVCRKSKYPNKTALFEVLFRYGKDWIRITNGVAAVLDTYHYFCFTHELEESIGVVDADKN